MNRSTLLVEMSTLPTCVFGTTSTVSKLKVVLPIPILIHITWNWGLRVYSDRAKAKAKATSLWKNYIDLYCGNPDQAKAKTTSLWKDYISWSLMNRLEQISRSLARFQEHLDMYSYIKNNIIHHSGEKINEWYETINIFKCQQNNFSIQIKLNLCQ